MSIGILAGISLAVVAVFVPLYFLLFVGARRAAVEQKTRAVAIAALWTGPVFNPRCAYSECAPTG